MFSEVIVAKNTGRKGQRRQRAGWTGGKKKENEWNGEGKEMKKTLKIKGGKLVPFRRKKDIVGVL